MRYLTVVFAIPDDIEFNSIASNFKFAKKWNGATISGMSLSDVMTKLDELEEKVEQ